MKQLRYFLRAFWRRFLRRPPLLRTIYVEELPEALSLKSFYVAGEGEYQWFAAMVCPCGCGETLHMSLLPEMHPRWEFTENSDSTPTLHPSVWRKVGCQSHFFLREGVINWCDPET